MSLGLACYDSSDSEEENVPIKSHKKPNSKQPVKIMAPTTTSVSSDEDEPPNKILKPAVKSRSGLFAKLPPPRNSLGGSKTTNRPLIPYVFQKAKTDAKQKTQPKITKKTTKQTIAHSSDEEDNVSFFSYVDKDELKKEAEVVKDIRRLQPLPTVNTPSSAPTVTTTEIPSGSCLPNSTSETVSEQSISQNSESTTSTFEKTDNWIDPEAMHRIQGKKHRNEKIEFIDVNQDERLAGNKELILKTISQEKELNRQSHSKKRNSDMPSSQQKRKHQMSYLIHQAKAREVELKNAWVAGKEKRDNARMRYGF